MPCYCDLGRTCLSCDEEARRVAAKAARPAVSVATHDDAQARLVAAREATEAARVTLGKALHAVTEAKIALTKAQKSELDALLATEGWAES